MRGYVALYRYLADIETVLVLAIRAQREADLSLRLRLSQHDLAAMLGLSRQTINKELGAFVEAGVIALRYRHISVLDTELLRQMASPD